jgi:hypothetical protein
LETTVGAACYAYSHFEMDCEWRYFLADHIRTEAGHGWGYIRQADPIDPRRDHSRPDPTSSINTAFRLAWNITDYNSAIFSAGRPFKAALKNSIVSRNFAPNSYTAGI